MLDIRFIRENADLVQVNSKNKGYNVDIRSLLELDSKRRDAQKQVEELRERRNAISSQMKNGKPDADLIAEGKALKTDLVDKENQFKTIDDEFTTALEGIPNLTQSDVPVGGEKDSIEIKKYGDQKTGATDHLDFAVSRDWIDFERGSKVSGAKFYYLKGDLALLENAIYQYALNLLVEKGFTFMTVPHMVNSRVLTGTGFAPRTSDQSDEYAIEGEDLS